jgi:hypothetical protein
MRDLQRLEELNSTAAVGLWAGDIVLALHRASLGKPLSSDQQLLEQAAAILEDALRRTDTPLAAPRSAHAFAASDTALTVVSALARVEHDAPEHAHDLLIELVGTVRQAASGDLGDPDAVAPLLKLFGTVSQIQLRQSNSVLASSHDLSLWTATPQM